MERKCAICGKKFKCAPSDKTVTCSKECSAANKRRTHLGKRNVWNEESKKRLSQKGKTKNLESGTEAAKKSPKSGRFETNVNAIEWHLISPEGEHFFFRSLNNWLRENGEKYFGCEPDSAQYKSVRSGPSGAKRAMLGGKYGCATYKGWQALPVEGKRTLEYNKP